MSIVLPRYQNSVFDQEYLLAVEEKIDLQETIAKIMKEVLTIISDHQGNLGQADLDFIQSKFDEMTINYDGLIQREQNIINAAQNAAAQSQPTSVLGYKPSRVMDAAATRLAEWQGTKNYFASGIENLEVDAALLQRNIKVFKGLSLFLGAAGYAWEAVEIRNDIVNEDYYAAMAGTTVGILEYVAGALAAIALSEAGIATEIVAAVGITVGGTYLDEFLTDILVYYDFFDFAELSPHPDNIERVAALENAKGLARALDPNISDADAIRLMDASSGVYGEQIDSFFSYVASYFDDGGDPFASTADLALRLREYAFQNDLDSYGLIDLTEWSAEQIALYAAEDTLRGRSIRYSIMNFVPFALNIAETPADDAQYDLSEFDKNYLAARAKFFEHYIAGNISNSALDPANGNILVSSIDEGYAQSFYDQDKGVSVYSHGDVEERVDHVFGGRDDDHIYGRNNTDSIRDLDYLYGYDGDDTLDGLAGSDILFGGDGLDTLYGREGRDSIYGEDDSDILNGGLGDDLLSGGEGDDYYFFYTGDGFDTISDGAGSNRLIVNGRDLTGVTLTAVSSGTTTFYKELDTNGNPVNDDVYILSPGELLIDIGGSSTGDKIRIITFDPTTSNYGLSLQDNGSPQQPNQNGTLFTVGDGYYGSGSFLSRTESDRVSGTSYLYDAAVYLANDPNGGQDYPYVDPSDPSQGVRPFRFDGGDSNDVLTGTLHTPAVPQLNGIGGDWLNGGDGDDLLKGEADTSQASGDNDHLMGGRGNDQLFGGGGNDVLVGWFDQLVPYTATGYLPGPTLDSEYENVGDKDYLAGGDGDDSLIAGRGNDTLIGGEGNDVIIANLGNDIITGGAGQDYIASDAYAITFVDGDDFYIAPDYHIDYTLSNDYTDMIDAGAGDDIVHAGAGDDFVYGGDGIDQLYGDQLNHEIAHRLTINGVTEPSANLTQRYADLAIQYHGNDYLDGGSGADFVFGNGGNDTAFGGDGDDVVFGDDFILTSDQHGNDYLLGEAGSDFLVGGGGSDTIYGGDDDDELYGDDGPQTITGYANSIPLYGPPTYRINGQDFTYQVASQDQLSDSLFGGAGLDSLYGHGGDDYLDGGDDEDLLLGGSGNDTLFGVKGADTLYGGSGDDVISGGADADTLYGEDGTDTLIGGTGNDVIESSSDMLIFSAGDGTDTVSGDVSEIRISSLIKGLVQSPGATKIQYGYGDEIVFTAGSFANIGAVFSNGQQVNIFNYIQANSTSPVVGTAGSDAISISKIGLADSIAAGQGDDVVTADSEGAYDVRGQEGDDQYLVAAIPQILNLLYDSADNGTDRIVLDSTIQPGDLLAIRQGDSLVLVAVDPNASSVSFADSTQVVVRDYFVNSNIFGNVEFGDGTLVSFADLAANAAFLGDDENDFLLGSSANDILEGNGGDDTIEGLDGDDTLIGGAGNDSLNGGLGNDTYVYALGDGSDVIYGDSSDATNNNVLQIDGVAPEDIVWSLSETNIVATLSDSNTITFYEAGLGLINGTSLLSAIVFNDTGTSIPFADIQNQYSLTLVTGDGNDNNIVGTDGAEYIDSGVGTDTVDPQGGDDYIIYNSPGDLTIVYGRDYGKDRVVGIPNYGAALTVRFEDESITPFDITPYIKLEQSGSGLASLNIQINGEDSLLTFDGLFDYFNGSEVNLEFADGSQFLITTDSYNYIYHGYVYMPLGGGVNNSSLDTMQPVVQYLTDGDDVYDTWGGLPRYLRAGAGDDIIYADNGTGGNDALWGETGNDYLNGGQGDDTYIFSAGDGMDVVVEQPPYGFGPDDGYDTIFIEGVSESDVVQYQDGDDLVIEYGVGDTIRVVDHYASPELAIESIVIGPYILNTPPRPQEDEFAIEQNNSITIQVAELLSNDIDAEANSLSITSVSNAANGNVVLNSVQNEIVFTPTTDFLGWASFEYFVSDGIQTSSADVSIQVVEELNEAPIAQDDLISTDLDTSVAILFSELLANDSDPDGDALFFETANNAVNGSIAIDWVEQTIVFTPNAGFTGNASFDYDIYDGFNVSTATVNIDVAAGNVAPNVNDDSGGTAEDTALIIPLADLLANDSDADGDSLSIISVQNAMNGSAVLDTQAGTITFTPDANYAGAANFDYTVSDGADTSTATVNVTVNAVNDAPVATDDAATTSQNAAVSLNISDLLSNDTDVDGDTLSITAVSNVQNGTALLDTQAGTITFTPATDYSGPASFDYTVSDGIDTAVGTVSLTIAAGVVVQGTAGDDVLQGLDNSDDTVLGQAGSDILTGLSGDDTLDGGDGDDTLNGDTGNDVFLFGLGGGHDVINNNDSDIIRTDTLRFQAGINPGDIALSANGLNLVLSVTNTTDQVEINNYFLDNGQSVNRVDAIEFADGTNWDYGTVITQVGQGSSGADVLDGITDVDDTLEGHEGDDTLTGNGGNDTYIYNPGDGNDTINNWYWTNNNPADYDALQFVGINPGDVVLSRQGNTLVIGFSNSTDQITVLNYFYTDAGQAYNALDAITFDDGTVWDFETVHNMLLQSTAGDDVIYGFETLDDTFNGGLGNDTLVGYGGNNTYQFGLGGGQDIVDNRFDNNTVVGQDNDVLQFETGIAPSDVIAVRVDDTLVLGIIGTTDQVAVYDYFADDGNGNHLGAVNAITFSDGTSWDYATITAMTAPLNTITGTAGYDTLLGTSGADFIDAGASNDTVDADAGNDTVVGGQGDDSLTGGDGDDTFLVTGTDQGYDVVSGGAGNDILLGSTGDDLFGLYTFTGTNTVETIDGNGGFDTIQGTYHDNVLDFSSTALIDIDRIDGGQGNDTITGSTGDDVIEGGRHNDVLSGGAGGSDTYIFNLGDGADDINNTNSGNNDITDLDQLLLSGIDHDQLWFSRQGDDLQIDYVGTDDQITIASWYNSNELYVLDEIATLDDGFSLDYADVDQLVTAMSQFAIPAGVGAVIPQDQQDTLAPTLAAVWS